jgi:hypothetical protein
MQPVVKRYLWVIQTGSVALAAVEYRYTENKVESRRFFVALRRNLQNIDRKVIERGRAITRGTRFKKRKMKMCRECTNNIVL